MARGSLARRPVFVTGATGFLGSHLVRALTVAGAEVHALRRRNEGGTPLRADDVTWHTGDILDPDSLDEALQKACPDVVFHLAAYGTTIEESDADKVFRTNVEGTLNLWKALSDKPCRIVHTGSCGEYGHVRGLCTEDQCCAPTWFYPATKNASVVLLSTLSRETGREVVTLRPFGPYGPADKPSRVVPQVIQTLLSGEPVRVTLGEQLRDYAFIDDHVSAFLLAATAELPAHGRIYNVGSGEVITLRHLIETIARTIGGDAPGRVQFGAVPYRETEVWEMCANIDAARLDLGFAPRVSLDEGIRRTVSWYRARGDRR
jgi:nucleoside-diphosphate-sugar epimerase